MIEALERVEFFVGQDNFLTPTVRYADIVLPATTFWERNDVHTPWAGALHYAIFMRQAIEPMYECRNDIDIFADLARRVGVDGLQRQDRDGMATRADRRRGRLISRRSGPQGVARFAPPEDAVAFARQIRDPDNHKFSTPSGKIEIYSMKLADKPDPYGLGRIPPIPTWIPPVDPDSALSAAAVLRQVAGAHAFDPRQPAAPGARRPRLTSG